MSYIDGFVAAVPAANKEAYRKHAADAAPMFHEFGGLRLVECWGDDVPEGKLTDFRRSVQAKEDEVIVFSWVEYPSKEIRDSAGQKMMTDPAMEEMAKDMPFDAKRMIYGGFSIVSEIGDGGEPGYVDGMLCAVPADGKETYVTSARRVSAVIQESGATRVIDAWGDDVPKGKITDFQGAVQATDQEVVVFSWIEWPSKEARDAGWQKAMGDPRMQDAMPFDMKRMIYGGFRPILDA